MLEAFKLLSPVIQSKIRLHHDLYPIIPVKAEYWESMVVDGFRTTLPHTAPYWDCGSQQIGRDIILKSGTEISCKAGQIHPDGRVKISSSRLSRFNDDPVAMRDYLTYRKTDDFMFCLSTHKTERKVGAFDGRYVYSLFPSDVVDYSTMAWEEFGKDQNLRGSNAQGVTLTMTKAMGWQVWFYIPCHLASASVSFRVMIEDDSATRNTFRPRTQIVAEEELEGLIVW